VSSTLTETIASPPPPDGPPEQHPRPWRGWLTWVALVLVCLWLADVGISLLIQHTALKGRVTSHLAAAFGRPVEVRSYRFTLWTGPALEARFVTVSEDPRFGQEYFLRAESLTLRIRWRSLFSGHLELGTISLAHPSLNLARDAEGGWNLAEWLPRPATSANPTANAYVTRALTSAPRFRKIDVDSGRINFKRGDEKLPFAFIGVNGTLETESAGLWRLDLVAVPSRAAVIVQQPGVLHLVGYLGGTSSRLRPAVLQLDWSNASLTDVLRLARGRDYGVRGNLGVSVTARTHGDSWLLQGSAALTQLHRWDLPLRADNPSVNVVASSRLDASGSRLELTQARIEAPHSSARVTGTLDWTLSGPDSPGTQLRVVSDALGLRDALAWGRAFHSNIAEGIALEGFAQLDLALGGWPPRLQSASLDFPRAEFSGNRLRVPVRLGPVLARYDQKKGITLSPTTVALGSAANSFRIDGFAKPDAGSFSVHLQGSTAQARDIAAASNQLGWNLARGWDVAGPVRCDLHWQGMGWPLRTTLAGVIEWGTPAAGASLHAQFLNLPIEQVRARAELKSGTTHLTLSSAQAFGAHWNGTLEHDLSDGWQFAVSGDALSAANLDRWLNPRWRESFLDRILPFLNSRAPAVGGSGGVRARGRLALDQFTLAPVVVRRLRGDLTLEGRHLELSNADGQFYRGQLSGSLRADLDPVPKYEASLDVSGADLDVLSAEFPSLVDVFSGSGSAKILLRLHGASRADLIDSLECRGTARVNEAAVEGLSLAETTAAGAPESGTTPFRQASTSFTCAAGRIEFQDLLLVGSNSEWDGVGTIDFARNLDVRVRTVDLSSPEPRPAKLTSGAGEEFRITGTLESLQISRVPISPRAPNEKP
jgi:AsmA-like C-terminal region/AsmA family